MASVGGILVATLLLAMRMLPGHLGPIEAIDPRAAFD